MRVRTADGISVATYSRAGGDELLFGVAVLKAHSSNCLTLRAVDRRLAGTCNSQDLRSFT